MKGKILLQEEKLQSGNRVHFVTGVASTVQLVGITDHPRETMAIVARGYTGVYDAFILPEDIPEHVNEILKTKLRTPMEMVGMTWLVKGVTRGWTHQAVRYRVGAAYVQESMRFWGMRDPYEILVPPKVARDEAARKAFISSGIESILQYEEMISDGVEDQDARGVLPTNVLTQMFMFTALNTLAHIFETRWCCQAQTTEWIPIMAQMKRQLRDYNLLPFLSAPIDRGEPCGFNASFDRPCVWKDRDSKDIEEELI